MESANGPRRACPARKLKVGAVILLLLSLAPYAMAQSMIISPLEPTLVPPAMMEFQTNRIGVLAPPAGQALLNTNAPLYTIGPVGLRPHLLYRLVYADGLLAGPGRPQSTVINEFGPGLQLDLGSHWLVDYTPTWRWYSNNRFRDTLDHQAALTGGLVYEDWVLQLSQSYADISEPIVETGGQTEEESFLTILGASHRLNSKLSLDLSVSQNFSSAQRLLLLPARNLSSFREWTTLDWVNYQIAPTLDVGLGVAFGYVDVDGGPDMTYEQLQGRVTWRAAEKISLQVRGGGEDRQFLSGGKDNLLNPVGGALIQYQPFEQTRLSLEVEQAVRPSYFQNQISESTRLSGIVNQRLVKHLFLLVGGGYIRDQYVSTIANVDAGRTDNYFYASTRLAFTVLKRGTVAIVYQHNENTSNDPSVAFNSDQVGLELGFRY